MIDSIKLLSKEHKDLLGVEPNIIGLRWHDQDAVINGIENAIETKKPYDEYLELSEEERVEFDNGDVLF